MFSFILSENIDFMPGEKKYIIARYRETNVRRSFTKASHHKIKWYFRTKKLSILKTNNTRVMLRYVEYRKENVNQVRIESLASFVLQLPWEYFQKTSEMYVMLCQNCLHQWRNNKRTWLSADRWGILVSFRWFYCGWINGITWKEMINIRRWQEVGDKKTPFFFSNLQMFYRLFALALRLLSRFCARRSLERSKKNNLQKNKSKCPL